MTYFIVITWITIIKVCLFFVEKGLTKQVSWLLGSRNPPKTKKSGKPRYSCVTVKLAPTKHTIWKSRTMFERFWKIGRELFLRSNHEFWGFLVFALVNPLIDILFARWRLSWSYISLQFHKLFHHEFENRKIAKNYHFHQL